MPDTRDRVFDRVTVDFLVKGTTRVSWGVYYQFLDGEPWDFQLQVGETGNPQADDWIDVGLPVRDAFYAVDATSRTYGTTQQTHYRVVMTTPAGVYTSNPAPAYGLLGIRDWLIAREIVRKERLRNDLACVEGWLLKRKRSGPTITAKAADDPRTMIQDPLTGDMIRRAGPAAVPTVGTPYEGGYYTPVHAAFDVTNPTLFDGIDPDMAGNANPDAVRNSGRTVLLPSLAYRDVFVAAHSDLRYEIGRIAVSASQRGVPLIGDAELRLIPFADIIYTVPVPAS